MNRILTTALTASLLLFCAASAPAADPVAAYPDREIHIVVPFAPGGAADVLTRKIGEKLQARLGQPVIVDNRAGGGTLIGSEFMMKAPADGYTLYSTNTTIIQLPILAPGRYDEARDFVPVVQYASAPLALAVLADKPIQDVKDLVAWVKARPGKTTYGSAGLGGSQHIYSEALQRAMGLDSVHAPYKGESPLLQDFLGGRLDWYIATPITILPHVRSGKVRLLAFTGDQRVSLMPAVPTFKEVGVPDLVVVGWYGMFAPAKTPKALLEKISKEMVAIVKLPDIAAYMTENGLIPAGLGTQEFGAKLPYFRDAYRRMIKENNITIE